MKNTEIKIGQTFQNKNKKYKVIEISRNAGVIVVDVFNNKNEHLATRNCSAKELLKMTK